jgi:hypothetical protein
MPAVLFAFIRHRQQHGREGLGQPGMYFIGSSHFRLSTPSNRRRKP